jgi:hypothetical protein
MRFPNTWEPGHTLLTFPRIEYFTTAITLFMDEKSRCFAAATVLVTAI